MTNNIKTIENEVLLSHSRESIKYQRHVFSNSLSKEWEKWEHENPLPEKAVQALKKYPKPPDKRRNVSGSKLFNEKSLNLHPEESQNNINIINEKRVNTKSALSSHLNYSDGKLNALKGLKNVVDMNMTDSTVTKRKKNQMEKKDRPKKYFLFHKRPSGKEIHLLCQKPTSVHFDISGALEHEEECFLEPSLTIDPFEKTQKLVKSRTRKVHCIFSSDEETGELLANDKTFSSNEKNEYYFPVEYGVEKNSVERHEKGSLGSTVDKIRGFLKKNKSTNKLNPSRPKNRLNKTKKNRNLNKSKNYESTRLNNKSSKTDFDSNKPRVNEYKCSENKSSLIFVSNENQESSVCCIPWVKEKMKIIEKEKRKAINQVQKLFPLDKARFLNTDISNENLVRSITSIYDRTLSINNFMSNYM